MARTGYPTKIGTVIETDALSAVDEIIADLSDRRGLKHEWRHIEPDIREEIRQEWAEIIARRCMRAR